LPKASSRIHRGLVGARELVGQSYLADRDLRREYETEIAPRTGAALARIFDAVALTRPQRVLDLGAGTGAAGRALLDRWPGIELVAVDKVEGPGIVQADLARAGRPKGAQGRFDLVVAAHLLGELSLDVEGRARLVSGWCRDVLADDGHCILIEPALRQTSRALLAVRDRLVAAGLFVVAPCLWQGACPALTRERDFCHASADRVAQGRSRVDFSYLVLRNQGRACGDTALFRVVSDPMKDKGRLRLFICGAAGRVLLTRLDRERSPGNQAFERIERGDVVRVEKAAMRSDGLRCTSDTTIARA
jgi:ribosomal protein RSM22 (predicted rRNA methylase)